MKKLFFFLLAAASLTACKKNSTDAPAPSAADAAKIKTATYGISMVTYSYDAQGRVTKTSNGDGSKTEYEYLPGVINLKIYNTAAVFQYSYKFELNADGLKIRTTVSNNPNYEVLYLYNADQKLAKEISHINGLNQGIDFFYSNGNLDSLRFTGNNGNWNQTTVFTYYTEKPNILANENYGTNFYGKDDKNMLKTEIYKYADGTVGDLASYAYEYDAQGRAIKQTMTQGNNIEIGLFTYY